MKTFSLMLMLGIAYTVFASVMHKVITHHPLNSDAKFAYFIIGMGLAVFTARKLDWID